MPHYCLLFAILTQTPAVAGETGAVLPAEAFFTSKMIPKVGDTVRVGVTLRSAADAPLPVPLSVELREASPGQPGREVGQQTVTAAFAPDESRDIAFDWKPLTTDWHQLTFRAKALTPAAGSPSRALPASLSVRVPVVTRDLYFAWFGSPTHFKWCNVPTTVKDPEEEQLWLRRGAWPCYWKGGVCYKEWPVERFADSYAEHNWIAIDEVGGPEEVTDKIVAGIREAKRRNPRRFVAVWYMGAHDYWRDVQDVVDLFLPEIYLNYRGNHLGQFESYLRTARATGTITKCIPGLGINEIKDQDTGEVRNSPTREDVLRQIRHLKRLAPDWPGVGFFTSGSAAPGVAEYGDQLCEEYYLDPVLRFASPALKVTGARFGAGARVTVRAEVTNVGGTPARNVAYVATVSGDTGRATVAHQGTLAHLSPDESQTIEFETTLPSGIRLLEVSLKQRQGVTLLDPTANRVVAGLSQVADPTAARLLCLPPADYPRTDLLISAPVEGDAFAVEELDASGNTLAALPAATRPLIPGGEATHLQFVAPGVTEANGRRFFLVRQRADEPAHTTPKEPENGLLAVERNGYLAYLNLTQGALVSLKVNDGKTELLKAPWTFRSAGWGEPAGAEISETPVGTQVVIPFESAEAKGVTRFTFYAHSPLIEIARRLQPLQPLEVESASEGAIVEQRGGVFACQPGLGGPINRGDLHDSDKYRDLLFGYLGEQPRPDNAERAGWFDFSWSPDLNAGLGVVVARRWRDAAVASYDVTRYYDAADWVQINHVWGTKTVIEREQDSLVYLRPHGHVPVSAPHVVSPAQALWESLRAGVEGAN